MELTPILIWWIITVIFGLVGWPLAFSLLRFLPDRGFAFARPLGLLLSGYVLWLGGSFRLLQNNTGGILTALAVLVLAVGLIWQHRQAQVPAQSSGQAGEHALTPVGWLRREWRYALSIELLYGLAFVGWAVFKAYNPNIETAGGEKWMEIAFINGTLRSDYFPPQDPWLAGFAISYYYFGYVLMAMVTRLTGLPGLVSTTAFNLYIPTLFAMTLTGAVGVVANLVSLYQTATRPDPPQAQRTQMTAPVIATGFVAALFVAGLGHLEGLLEVIHKRGLLPANFWRWLDIRDLKVPPAGPGDSWIPDRFMWWWRGSRVLTDYSLTGHEQEVIDEFPFFSFLLGDVHPHVLALPFVLLVVALALNLLANPGQKAEAGDQSTGAANIVDKLLKILQNSWHALIEATGGRTAFVLYAVCLGGLSFLNTWDFPIYLSVVGLAFLARPAQRLPTENSDGSETGESSSRPDSTFLLSAMVGGGAAGGVERHAVLALFRYLPVTGRGHFAQPLESDSPAPVCGVFWAVPVGRHRFAGRLVRQRARLAAVFPMVRAAHGSGTGVGDTGSIEQHVDQSGRSPVHPGDNQQSRGSASPGRYHHKRPGARVAAAAGGQPLDILAVGQPAGLDAGFGSQQISQPANRPTNRRPAHDGGGEICSDIAGGRPGAAAGC